MATSRLSERHRQHPSIPQRGRVSGVTNWHLSSSGPYFISHNERSRLDYVRLLWCRRDGRSQLRDSRVAPSGAGFFPLTAVEWDHRHRLDRIAIDAASVDADAVGMGAGDVKGL